jgi:hypothetical protein
MPLMTVVLLEKPRLKYPLASSGLILTFASLCSGHVANVRIIRPLANISF